MGKSKFRCFLYWLAQWTWGIVMNLLGGVVVLALIVTGHRPRVFHYAVYVEVGNGWGGLELGGFFLCGEGSADSLKMHEHGHGYQNIMFGPLMPFLVSIPSAIRYWYREIMRRRDPAKYAKLPPYDAIWFEGQATELGERYCWEEVLQ